MPPEGSRRDGGGGDGRRLRARPAARRRPGPAHRVEPRAGRGAVGRARPGCRRGRRRGGWVGQHRWWRGLLAALGARLVDADGDDLADGGAALAGLDRLDLSGLDPRLATTPLVLAADVDSPLLGPAGAAAVFAPQKGATPDRGRRTRGRPDPLVRRGAAAIPVAADRPMVTSSDIPASAKSTNWSNLAQQPGGGAAGGVGFALLTVLGAQRRSGVDVVLDLVGLDAALAGADLLVTGEGALDEQTLAGKAVAGVARRAQAHGIPAVAVCGKRRPRRRGPGGARGAGGLPAVRPRTRPAALGRPGGRTVAPHRSTHRAGLAQPRTGVTGSSPPSTASTFVTARSAIAVRVSTVADPMCGSSTTSSRASSPGCTRGSSS